MQRKLFVNLCLALFFVGVAPFATQAQSKSPETELLNLIKQFVETQRTFDAVAMEKLLTADYVEVSPAGEVDERAKVLSFYSPAAQASAGEAPAITVDEPTYRIQKNTAIVIVRETFKRKMGEQVREFSMRAMFSLRQEAGAWRIASAQYTGIRPTQPK